MEKVRDSSLMLGIANSVGLIGAVIYYHKRLEALETTITTLTQRLDDLTNRTEKFSKDELGKRSEMKRFMEDVQELKKVTSKKTDAEVASMIAQDLEQVILALEQNNMPVELQSSRRNRRRGYSSSDDEYEATSRRPVKAYKTRARLPARSERFERERERVEHDHKPSREFRDIDTTTPLTDINEDEAQDLIKAARQLNSN